MNTKNTFMATAALIAIAMPAMAQTATPSGAPAAAPAMQVPAPAIAQPTTPAQLVPKQIVPGQVIPADPSTATTPPAPKAAPVAPLPATALPTPVTAMPPETGVAAPAASVVPPASATTAVAPALAVPAPQVEAVPATAATTTQPAPAQTASTAQAVPGTNATAVAPVTKKVGGAMMSSTKNIIENASLSKDHTTLVKAIKAVDLVPALSGPGPFTVFAPTNAAFAKFPPGAVNDLLKPANKAKLTKILNYHVLAGTHDLKSIMTDIKIGGGVATYTTLAGGTLKASDNKKGGIKLTDDNGNVTNVTIPDVYQSNGVIHVVDTVVIPK